MENSYTHPTTIQEKNCFIEAFYIAKFKPSLNEQLFPESYYGVTQMLMLRTLKSEKKIGSQKIRSFVIKSHKFCET